MPCRRHLRNSGASSRGRSTSAARPSPGRSRRKRAPTILDKSVRSICDALNKIDGTTLTVVDTLQFDATLAMDEVLKDIKARAAGAPRRIPEGWPRS